ncbi:MAG TPA: RNA methyltransferase [Nitrososphaerales archaeon]|nr:RNA methyltransferase [Nitrososphaerales archaeon]
MTFSGRRLGVALPDTVLEEHDSLREKTVKLGTIARSCAIYGVDTIIVFRDPKGRGESRLITRVLEYLETPQYLRRSLFGFDEALKYAGLLPPLRIPSHKQRVQVEKLKVGEIREGVTLSDGRVNIGLEKHPYLGQHLGANKRVTVRIKETTPLTSEVVAREAAHEYWGYSVELRTLDELVADERFELKIATSRYGNSIRSVLGGLRVAFEKANSVVLIFGSPSRGLFEIVGKDLSTRIQFVINLFGEQHVETVRTEEAIGAGLYLVNVLSV